MSTYSSDVIKIPKDTYAALDPLVRAAAEVLIRSGEVRIIEPAELVKNKSGAGSHERQG